MTRPAKYYCDRDKKKIPWQKVRRVCLVKSCVRLFRIFNGMKVKV